MQDRDNHQVVIAWMEKMCHILFRCLNNELEVVTNLLCSSLISPNKSIMLRISKICLRRQRPLASTLSNLKLTSFLDYFKALVRPLLVRCLASNTGMWTGGHICNSGVLSVGNGNSKLWIQFLLVGVRSEFS